MISNFDPRLSTTLDNTKLRHFFDFILTSYEVGTEKPDKEIFQEAMRRSNIPDLKPEECLHIGDTAMTDYYGARNSNWNAFLVHERSPEELKAKYEKLDLNHVFSSLLHVHKHFMDSHAKRK